MKSCSLIFLIESNIKIRFCIFIVYMCITPHVLLCSQDLNLFEAIYRTCDVTTTTESRISLYTTLTWEEYH